MADDADALDSLAYYAEQFVVAYCEANDVPYHYENGHLVVGGESDA